MFFVYDLAFKFFKIFSWVYCYSNNSRVINTFNQKITEFFSWEFISDWIFLPKFVWGIKSTKNITVNENFKQKISKLWIWGATFWFPGKKKKKVHKCYQCLSKLSMGKFILSYIYYNFLSFFCLERNIIE